MTKNEIKARLELMLNLADEVKKIGDTIADLLSPNAEDDIWDLLNKIESHEERDLPGIMQSLDDNGYFENISEGYELHYPTYHVNDISPDIQELRTVSPNGGTLIASTSVSDYRSVQASICYQYNPKAMEIDISTAEIKAGGLAEACDRPASNQDLDLYIYTNPGSEDFSNVYSFKSKDLRKATYSRWLIDEIKTMFEEKTEYTFAGFMSDAMTGKLTFTNGDIHDLTDSEVIGLLRWAGIDDLFTCIDGEYMSVDEADAKGAVYSVSATYHVGYVYDGVYHTDHVRIKHPSNVNISNIQNDQSAQIIHDAISEQIPGRSNNAKECKILFAFESDDEAE